MNRYKFPIFCLLILAWPSLAELLLEDKICAIVGAERPILLSDVQKRAQEDKISPKEAYQLLLQDRALEQYAKTQQKLSLSSIHEAAEKHLKTIMEKNNLDAEKFAEILRRPPYSTTVEHYEEETAFAMLKNQIETSFAQSIHINEKKVQEAQKTTHKNPESWEIYFISILPIKSQEKQTVIPQTNKANSIKYELKTQKQIDSVKEKYKDQKDVSFIGPIDYKKGDLVDHYEAALNKDPKEEIIGPFKDKQALTLIVRREKALPLDKEETGLENIRNKLYEEGVAHRMSAVTKEILENTPIEVNCEW